MRLKSISIEGFRAFGRSANLDLDADVIILQGSNGVGKTSLLDAILFALTGRIARFADRGSPISLYAREGYARVELTLASEQENISIVRVADKSATDIRLRVGAAEYSGATAQQQLGMLLLPNLQARPDDRDALGTVLTRGIYLQQDLVRQFVEGDSAAERFTLVSEIIGAGIVLELQQTLEKSRAQWSRDTSSLRKTFDELNEQLRQLNEQLARFSPPTENSDPTQLQSGDIKEVAQDLYRRAVQAFGEPRFAPLGMPDTSGRLDRFVRQLAHERAALERAIEVGTNLAEEWTHGIELGCGDEAEAHALQGNEERLSEELSAATSRLEVEIQRLTEQRERDLAQVDKANRAASMAKLAIEDLGAHCPVCEQTHDVEHTRQHLLALIEAATAPLPEEPDGGHLQQLSEARAKIAHELEVSRSQLLSAVSRQRERDARRDFLIQRLRDFGIDQNGDVAAHLAVRVNEAEVQLADLRHLIADAESFSLLILRLGEHRQLVELTRQKVELSPRIAELDAQIREQEGTHALAGTLIDGLRDASLAVTQKQIDQIAPLFQRIYSRIDPHPTFRVTQMMAEMQRGKGLLNVGISDPGMTGGMHDAGPLLSSSQLNSYAVSLFLAMNLALSSAKLGVTILDDPLQSLDSINLLGLVDVLRRFRAHRQIIVSTHEDRLVGLLQRKLRPVRMGERMITLLFDDWSREGPSIRTVPSNFSDDEANVLAA